MSIHKSIIHSDIVRGSLNLQEEDEINSELLAGSIHRGHALFDDGIHGNDRKMTRTELTEAGIQSIRQSVVKRRLRGVAAANRKKYREQNMRWHGTRRFDYPNHTDV